MARAGFITAPVKLPPTRASTKIARPMPNPPILGASGDTAVPNTALTRKNVSIASIHTPCMNVTSLPSRGVPTSASPTAARGSIAFSRTAPTTAPASCAPIYCHATRPPTRFAIHRPNVTAGFMWPPEMLIVIDTMIAMATPCARATPSEPMLVGVVPAATGATTLPAPRNTNSSVPTNSATRGRSCLGMRRFLGVGGELRPPQDERRVDPAEAERVGEHDLGRGGAALARQAIQVAGGGGALEVESGREPAALDRQGADRRLDGTAGAEGVPVVTLGTADAEAGGVRAEHLLDGGGLGRVVERRGRPVRVDVADVVRRDVRIGEREPHRPGRLAAVGAGRRHVIGVVGERVARELGVDAGAAGHGPLPLLQHQHRCALPHDEAVAILVEGTGRVRGGVVARAPRPDHAA